MDQDRAGGVPAKRMSRPPEGYEESDGRVPLGASRLAAWLVQCRVWLAIVAAVLTAVAVNQAQKLEFSQSIETMFDRTDPALPPYDRLARTFGASEVVLAVYDDAELFTPAGIKRLRELTATLAAVPGVASVMSLADTPLGDRIIQLDTMPMAGRVVELMEGYVVGADHRTAGIACVLAGAAAADADPAAVRDDAIDQIRGVMAGLPAGTVAGEPVMLRDGFAMLRRDGNLLGTAAGLLAGGVILVLFRSLRWVVVPLAVVVMALWTTRGVLATAGVKLTMVSTMLSAMITVVGIATVTHLIVEFRRQREAGLEPVAAMQQTLARLLWPVAGAIATDMIGFGSLIASRVGPVHDFGIMTALGAGLVLVAVVLTTPFLALAGRFDADPRRSSGEGGLERGRDALELPHVPLAQRAPFHGEGDDDGVIDERAEEGGRVEVHQRSGRWGDELGGGELLLCRCILRRDERRRGRRDDRDQRERRRERRVPSPGPHRWQTSAREILAVKHFQSFSVIH